MVKYFCVLRVCGIMFVGANCVVWGYYTIRLFRFCVVDIVYYIFGRLMEIVQLDCINKGLSCQLRT